MYLLFDIHVRRGSRMTRDELKHHLEDFATSLTLMADCDAKDAAVAEMLRKIQEALTFRVEADMLEGLREFDPQQALVRREVQARIRRTTGELAFKPTGS
jgi:hypothetical protein